MEARFILLHPDDPGEILLATALIRCLKTQVEEALVYSVVKESHRWLLETNPYLDEIFVYRENPIELLDPLKDFLPDYLIDLDGRREVRRFKNRLKVLDFTIKRKDTEEPWSQRAFETCTLFDVQDDDQGPQFVPAPFDAELLPSDFRNGYLVLSLDVYSGARSMSDDDIVNLAVMIEKPIVVTGRTADRNLANRISQSAGCAVFPTCGDLPMPQIASLVSQAKGIVVFDPVWMPVSAVLGIKRIVIAKNSNLNNLNDLAIRARSFFNPGHERNTN